MKTKTLSLALIAFLGFVLAACNLPTTNTNTDPSLKNQAGTLAAQTLTAAAEQMPSETPVPLNTPTKPRPTVTPAPTLSPTPTVKANIPAKPSLQNYNFFCSWNGANTDLSVTIEWTDRATDETGYYIYRNGEQAAKLPANTQAHVDTFAVDQGVAVTYGIEAYNSVGSSEQATFTVTCE